MSLKSTASRALSSLNSAEESPDLALRDCHDFIAFSWATFHPKANQQATFMLFKDLNAREVASRAGSIVDSFRRGSRVETDLTSPLELLALLRAADELAANDLPKASFRLRIAEKGHKITLATPVTPFGANFTIRRISPDKKSPAFGQNNPCAISILHHRVMPDEVGEIRFELSEFHRLDLAAKQSVKVYAGGYSSPRDWKGARKGKNGKRAIFSKEGGINRTARMSELTQHILEAAKLSVDIILLPELTITPTILADLTTWCRNTPEVPQEMIILPGTFHDEDFSFGKVNKAVLLDGNGRCANHTQLKIEHFEVDEYKEVINVDKPIVIYNFLLWGAVLNILICIDFCNKDGLRLGESVFGDVILVPSMGYENTARAHTDKCQTFKASRRPRVAVAQEMLDGGHWACVFNGDDLIPADAPSKRELPLVTDLPLA